MVYGIYRPWMRRPNTTIINHNNYMNLPNGCGYGTGGCGGGISNKALALILGLTGGFSLAGGILGGFFQNRQARAEAQEQKLLQQGQDAKNATAETLTQLKNTYGDEWNVMVQGEEFILQNKEDPSKIICGTTLKSIVNQIAQDSKATTTETVEENPSLTEEEIRAMIATEINNAKENNQPDTEDTPAPTGTHNPVKGDTTLPGEYTWGKMGATDDKYKDKTAEEIARDVLGNNASDEAVGEMAEKIKNMNPNAFGSDGKVNNPSRLNVPEKTTTANNTTSDNSAKIDAPVTFSIQPLKGNKNTASVTIDGKTYTATIKAIDWKGGKAIRYVDDFFKAAISFDDNKITEAIKQDLIEELEKQIKADGYTNVNLYNNNPDVEVLNFGTPPA